jgi:hypothetical protein
MPLEFRETPDSLAQNLSGSSVGTAQVLRVATSDGLGQIGDLEACALTYAASAPSRDHAPKHKGLHFQVRRVLGFRQGSWDQLLAKSAPFQISRDTASAAGSCRNLEW